MPVPVGPKTQSLKARAGRRRRRIETGAGTLRRRLRLGGHALTRRHVKTRIRLRPFEFRPLHHRRRHLRKLSQISHERPRPAHAPFSRLSFAALALASLLLRTCLKLLSLVTITKASLSQFLL